MVSIVMITYNHKEYIRQAVESILMQNTTFDFELIISNDCSPDNTDNIIENIIENHPNGSKIKYFSHPKNLGMMPNFIFALEQCKGKYIALCEGDDYWINPLKLQKQVDFLEKETDFSICFHNVNILKNDSLKEDNIKKRIPDITTIENLAKGNYINTPSVVFRNGLIPKFPEYFAKAPIGDYLLHLLNAKYGKIKYVDEVMAVYRIHETSYWSSKKELEQDKIVINFITEIKNNFDPEIQIILDNQILKIQYKRMLFLQKMNYKFNKLLKIIN
jgi:glycosyltransferase involved in cell wall biosynthesis